MSSTAGSDCTVSTGWRIKGNYSFKNFKESNNNARRRNYLESALNSYYRSFETADSNEDKSSAAKNYATAAWRLVTVLKELEERQKVVEFRVNEAIKYFSKAMLFGRYRPEVEWCDTVSTVYGQCVDGVIEDARALDDRDRVAALERCVDAMCESSQKPKCYLEMATVLSQAGVAALGSKDFVTALQAFHDCHRPINECFRMTAGTGEINSEASVINADIGFHRATAEALQAITIGDEILSALLEQVEIGRIDPVYDAMDWYKKAIIATREIEVEMEAIAASRLGSLFDKFDRLLKMKSKAKDYFKMSLQLAASAHPRNFATENWYKTCVEALQRYQAEAVNSGVDQEEIREAERQQYLVELQSELADLHGANVGSNVDGFLRHVYKTYPPKNPEHTLDDSELSEKTKMKKAILKAIHHYHPDKQDMERHGRKWKVLCEEITKLLNHRYEAYKFPDTAEGQ